MAAPRQQPTVSAAPHAAWPVAGFRPDYLFSLGLALVASTLVFLPHFGFKGVPGGGMFQGDTLNFWVPQFGVLEYFTSHGVFSGIDYTTQNGAAEWFLRPNLVAYHPLYLLLTFVTHPQTAMDQALAVLSVLWVHAFVSLFCAYRLCRAFLGFDRALGAFVAVGFTFSGYLPVLIGYVPYGFVIWLMPPIIYGCLAAAHRRTPLRVLFASFPAFCSVLGGYLPLSIFSMGMAWLFFALYVFAFLEDNETIRSRFMRVFSGTLPLVVAAAFTGFFLLALQSYLKGVIEPAYDNNIGYSAYDLAEHPTSFFRLLSPSISFPGQYTEFTLYWGWIVLAIFICSLVRPKNQINGMSRSYRNMFGATLLCYLFFALLIFGNSTAISALFYFFAPVVGFMHIYQRFLPAAEFFLMVSVAVMLSNMLASEQRGAEKALLGIYLALVAVMTWIILKGIPIAPIGYGDAAIMEVIYGCVFLLAVILLPRSFAIWAATFLMLLVPLGTVYTSVTNKGINIEAQKPQFVPLNEAEAAGLDRQLLSFQGGKKILKYVDTTPGIYGTVPENYPWFRINTAYMSTYTGYDFHVGVPRDYRLRNPTTVPAGVTDWRVLPDPSWIRVTGADAILYDPTDAANNPALIGMVDLTDPSKVFTVRGKYTLAPLKTDSPTGGSAADNGYFRIAQAGRAGISNFQTNTAGSFDFTTTTDRAGRLEYLFWPNSRLVFEVNGRAAVARIGQGGLLSIDIPAGANKIKVRYQNLSLTLFLFGYALYVTLLVVGLIGTLVVTGLSYYRKFRNEPKAKRTPSPKEGVAIPPLG